jgi:hypothetical protein
MWEVRGRFEVVEHDLEALAQAIENGSAVGADPRSLMAAFAWAGLGDDLGPTLVREPPTRPKLVYAARETSLAKLFPRAPRRRVLSVSAGLLQILDAWDESHEAAQEADDLGESQCAPYWHGIAHRREPDPGNAAYWFRRVGPHSVYPMLAESVKPWLDARNVPFVRKLADAGSWDPIAFISFCQTARAGDADLARRIQRMEMLILLDETLSNL